MKNFCLTFILILAFCAISLAQTNQNLKCPTISVNGPATIIEPGDTGSFTANVNDENWVNYTYSWTITGANFIAEDGRKIINLGKKVEAVGKNVIRFQIPPEIAGESLTATVEIKGFPEGCPNESSETMVCSLAPVVIEVDEFSISAIQIDKAKLNNLLNFVQDNPSAQIYIIERFNRKTSQKIIKQKNQNTIDYLKSRGIGREFIRLFNSFGIENQTRFILVPLGAKSPSCDDCVEIETK